MSSPSKRKKVDQLPNLEKVYGLKFPDSLGKFWKSCLKNSPLAPLKAIKNWNLVGPFKILARQITFENRIDALLYHRCYHDLPEFQTFAVSKENGKRLCFYRLTPESLPFIVSVTRENDDIIMPKFEYISETLEESVFSAKPKKSMVPGPNMVAPTLSSLGISVFVKNDVGYRDLNMSDKKFRKILDKIENAKDDNKRKEAFAPLLDIITCIQFANDECDFGMAYEFGYDLFIYRKVF